MPGQVMDARMVDVEEGKARHINALKQLAHKELVDFEERPLDKWLKSCEILYKQMELALSEGDARRHYIFSMRLCNLVNDQLPKHPEYKQVKHKEMKKRVAKMIDDSISDVRASKEALLKKEERRLLDQAEERKRLEAEAVKFDTKAVGDSIDAARSHISVGDALIREGLKSLPSQQAPRPVSWGASSSLSPPSYHSSTPISQLPPTPAGAFPTVEVPDVHFLAGNQRGGAGRKEEEYSIGVPIHDEGADLPFLLPKDNRMTFDSFVQQERKWVPPNRRSIGPPPLPLSSRRMPPPPPSSSTARRHRPEEDNDEMLARALAESASMARQEDSKMARLRERLETYTEYELEEVDNTGHCQFDAVAHQIKGRFTTQYSGGADYASRYTWREVRRDVAHWLRACGDFILENGERIKDFLDEEDGKTWAEFTDNVEHKDESRSPLWGNHLTLIAAANCYQRPIRVWSTQPGKDWWLQINPKHYNPQNPIRPFELAHLYERHYLSVTERKSSKNGSRTR